ncbi:MAG: hypothetical protein OXP73_14530 [Chloroflexota bacterium]|nr:hypothetical protein [Chloroflexota bacterium]MDE2904230.1 hypothetical protein [Chloroflexota bacterium]
MTLELWNFLLVIHQFSGTAALGAFTVALVVVVQGRRMALAGGWTDGLPTEPVLRALNRWITAPSMTLLLASGLGLALTNSYRMSPTFLVTSTVAMGLATAIWLGVMLPAEVHFRAGRQWTLGWRRWVTGWIALAVLVLFAFAMMIIRPVWWPAVTAWTPG